MVDEDGLIRPNITKGQPAEAASSEFASIEQTLDFISVSSHDPAYLLGNPRRPLEPLRVK